MTKYDVYYTTTATVRVSVEADNPEMAEELADTKVYINLCHQCAHKVDVSDSFELVDVVEDRT